MWLRPPKARPIAGSVCVGELAREVHRDLARPGDGAARRRATAARSIETPKASQRRSWISATVRRVAGRRSRVEAVEDLVGELGGDRRGR